MGLLVLLSLILALVAIPAALPLSDPRTHSPALVLQSQHHARMGQPPRLVLRGGSCADVHNAPEHAIAEKMESKARLSAQMTALWAHTEQLRRFAASPATIPPAAGDAAGAAAGSGGGTACDQDPGMDTGGGVDMGGADGAQKEQGIVSEEQAELAVRALEAQLSHPSALFRHELCYALGQAGRASAGVRLREVLSDRAEHEMVILPHPGGNPWANLQSISHRCYATSGR